MLTAIDTLKCYSDVDPHTMKTITLIERGLTQIKDTVGALLVEAKTHSRKLTPHDIEDVLTLITAMARKKGLHIGWHNSIDEEVSLPATFVRQILIKLLRAIQERHIVRVGGETPIPVEIRLVCATHQDPKKMVEGGKFREVLYYPYSRHPSAHSTLARTQGRHPLAGRATARKWSTEHSDPRTMHRSTEKALLDHPWPGNIRELKHFLERACILSQQNVLSAELLFDDVPTAQTEQSQSIESLNEYLHACERKFIQDILRSQGGIRLKQPPHSASAGRICGKK